MLVNKPNAMQSNDNNVFQICHVAIICWHWTSTVKDAAPTRSSGRTLVTFYGKKVHVFTLILLSVTFILLKNGKVDASLYYEVLVQ